MVLLVLAYVAAAARYPGGTQLDPTEAGYSHLGNFWCDLLAPFAYNGAVNAARPIALAATWIFALSLIPMFAGASSLWPRAARERRVVPVFGALAMLSFIAISTPYHDAAIQVGVVTGGVAFALLIHRIGAAKLRALMLSGTFALGLGACDYAAYMGGAPLTVLPGFQKLAGAALLVWFWQLTRAIDAAER